MIEIYPSIIQGLISVSTAFIILKLERWNNKRKNFKALYGEVEINLNIAENLVPLVKSIGSRGRNHSGTIFDLQLFHVNCFEEFKRSGYFITLDENIRKLVEEVYEQISSHNYQTNDLHSPTSPAEILELAKHRIPPPLRTGGYSERLTSLIPKLKDLRDKLCMHKF